MVNRAVVAGVVGSAAALYAASEKLKDLSAEAEAAEIEHCKRKFEAAHREIQREKQKSGGFTDEEMHEMQQKEQDDLCMIFEVVEKQVMSFISCIQEKVTAKQRNYVHDREETLRMPLMSSTNSSSEILLALALATGNPSIVEAILSQRIDQSSRLGLGVAKLTCLSVFLIQKEIQVMVQTSELFPREFDNEDISLLAKLLFASFGHQKFQEGKPDALTRQTSRNWSATKTQRFNEILLQVGLFLIPFNACSASAEVKFGGGAAITLKPKQYASLSMSPGENYMLTNHTGAVTWQTDREGRIECIVSNTKARIVEVGKEEKLDLISSLLSLCVLKCMSEHLTYLSSKIDNDLSLEIISAFSGYGGSDGDRLRELHQHDAAMFTNNEASVRKVLMKRLECIPSPETPVDSLDQDSLTPSPLHKQQISEFVENYLLLLKLCSSEIPRLGGRSPSHFVARTSVWSKAEEQILETSRRPVLTRHRKLENHENHRLKQSRELISPPKMITIVLLVVLTAFFSWLSWELSHTIIWNFVGKHIIPISPLAILSLLRASIYLFALACGVQITVTTLSMLKDVFAIPKDKEGSLTQEAWNAASCIVEYGWRCLAILMGKPTPFEQKVSRLKRLCKNQHRVWNTRLAMREYYECIRRKKITYSQCTLLLSEFSEPNPGPAQGVLPGDASKAEEFLALEIQENGNESGKTKSSMEAFLEMDSQVSEVLTFSFGDRVVVDGPSPKDSEKTAVAQAPDTSLVQARPTGSVVGVLPGMVLLHLDGHPHSEPPRIVAATSCTRIADKPGARDDNGPKMDIPPLEKPDDKSDGQEIEEEKIQEEAPDVPSRKRSRTVEEALQEGGWTLVRRKNHIRYQRRIRSPDGSKHEQNFTMASTPSDSRAWKNALAQLHRLDNEGIPVPACLGQGLHCCVCFAAQPEDCFSRSQLKKYLNGSNLKCRDCVNKLK